MTLYTLILCLPMLGLLVAAAVIDVRARRIPNWLTLTLILSGIGRSLLIHGPVTPGRSMLGLLMGFGPAFLLFAMGALGGGDVKLLAGIGAWLGPAAALWVFMLSAIAGMLMVLAISLRQGKTQALLGNTAILTVRMFQHKRLDIAATSETASAFKSVDKPLPFAVAVLMAMGFLFAGMPLMEGKFL